MARGGGGEANIPIKFDQGLVTARDPSTLTDGELQVATGCEYRVGSPALYKVPGRSTAGTISSSASVTGLQLCQYDTGTDTFVATSGTGVYESVPGTSLSFTVVSSFTRTANSPPSFLGFSDRWLMVNGVDDNYIREPLVPAVTNTGYFQATGFAGGWRRAGMKPADGTTAALASATTGSTVRSWSDATGLGGFTNYISIVVATGLPNSPGANSALQAYDSTASYASTYAWGNATSSATTKSVLFTYTGGGTGSSTTFVSIVHSGAALPPDDDVDRTRDQSETSAARHKIQYRLDGTDNAGDTGWITLSDRTGVYAATTSSFAVPSGAMNNIRVRARTTWVRGSGGTGRVYDLYSRTGTGASTTFSTTNPIYYFVTERYYDGDGVAHESRASYLTSPGITLSGAAGVLVTLPSTKINATATEFVIYRSIDEAGGGYPDLWEIDTVQIAQTVAGGGAQTQYLDPLTSSLTSVADKQHLYDILTVLYPTGETLTCPLNDPPPKAKAAVQFLGSIVYVPVEYARKLWYSVPCTLNAASAEQVPAYYHLEFTTSNNDTIQAISLCNGGKTMVVFFPSYTMMVSYLPQANDPGVFDTRVKEFVSNMRGAAGPRCVCDFTTPQGAHLAAAVDSLGLWCTDGVSMVMEASNDLAWSTLMSGVDLSTAELRNNPLMRRLELVYNSTGSTYQEIRFYYGEMKANGQPKITGPDPAGYRTKHYNFLTTQYRGWSGSKSADGKVFLERGQDSDDSNGYNGSGHVPFTATNGDMYIGGLGGSVMATMGYPKFEAGAKTINFVGTFRRDGFASAQTKTKTFVIGTQRKIYWHYYADRHNVSVQDISATALPAIVGYEITVVGTGDGREK